MHHARLLNWRNQRTAEGIRAWIDKHDKNDKINIDQWTAAYHLWPVLLFSPEYHFLTLVTKTLAMSESLGSRCKSSTHSGHSL